MKNNLLPIIVVIVSGTCDSIPDDLYSKVINVYRNYKDSFVESETFNTIYNAMPPLGMNMDKYMAPTEWNGAEGKLGKIYDFIVIGSGSAGSVIANRLTENPKWNVLLLEAGKGENDASRMPILAPIFQLSHYNWDYRMEYQSNFAQGIDDKLLAWPRGKALGGSTVINYMIYTRGNPRDFNTWAANGNPGWSYKDVLPYFMKSERSRLKRANPAFHGTTGELGVEDIYQSQLLDGFVRGGQELGYPYVDYTSDRQMGFSPVQATTLNGARHSVAKAFLHPIRSRKNLRIYTSAFVTKILINNEKQAYGVEYERNGKLVRAYARKEVILSAGALASPQLLMLSGIGVRNDLEKLKIPVIQDLPVGRNLHDHITYIGLSFLINKDVGVSLPRNLNPKHLLAWLTNGTGPNSSLGGVGGIGYIKTYEDKDADPTFPDMELIFVDGAVGVDFGVSAKSMKMRDEVWQQYFGPIAGKPAWTIFPMLLHPKSRGHMKLASRNPYDHPKFYGNYFSDPANHDLKTMVASIRFIQALAKTSAFKKFGSNLHEAHVPGCEGFTFDTDVYWKCALETLSITLHHQVGTCKMGPKHDPTAVVGHTLKVHGIKNLRVADTSVIPFALTAHTNAPAIMVGEKAADIIKADWTGRT